LRKLMLPLCTTRLTEADLPRSPAARAQRRLALSRISAAKPLRGLA
jgi:hypothetical protein